MKKQYKINRFPICEIVHYAVAKRLGYEDYLAKSLSHATAIFYAVAKRGGFVRNGSKKSKSSKTNPSPKTTENIRFCDRLFYATRINGKVYPKMGDKVITEKDFDKSLRSKLSQEEIDAILSYAIEYVSQFSENTLRRPFEIYKKVRDEWRTIDFWDNLMKNYKIMSA